MFFLVSFNMKKFRQNHHCEFQPRTQGPYSALVPTKDPGYEVGENVSWLERDSNSESYLRAQEILATTLCLSVSTCNVSIIF